MNSKWTISKGDKLYFMGVGGTGMAAVAGLMQAEGFKVCGSDKEIYPPMSGLLESLAIPVMTPYSPENLKHANPDLVVVANCLSKGHPEIEQMLSMNLPFTSFPGLLEKTILSDKQNIVVAGTHGKTTTASLTSWCLDQLGLKPGFLIGGIPENFSTSFDPGKGEHFVIEGDEYDTAYFDKESKFLHYKPEYLVLNNLEYDHADIFENFEAVKSSFKKLLSLVKTPSRIIANMDDPGVKLILQETGLSNEVCGVSVKVPGQSSEPDLTTRGARLQSYHFDQNESLWHGKIWQRSLGIIDFRSRLGGPHNMANICQVIALAGMLAEEGRVDLKRVKESIGSILEGFKGVRRRLDSLGAFEGIEFYEDFAHHPTAVRNVLEGMRQIRPDARILVAFDPANATCRRNTFVRDYGAVFKQADQTLLGPVQTDLRIPEAERMNTSQLADLVGPSAKACQNYDELCSEIRSYARKGDVVLFMSSGSFGGVPARVCREFSEGALRGR